MIRHKENIEKRKRDKENEKRIINVDTISWSYRWCNFLLFVPKVVYFLADEVEKCKEKQFHFAINDKVSQSTERRFIYLFYFI